MINKTGKTIAKRIPILKFSWNIFDVAPTTVGPMEQPKSPAKANMANMGVPPLGQALDDILMVPGQRIPTEKPVIAQPINESIGKKDKEVSK